MNNLVLDIEEITREAAVLNEYYEMNVNCLTSIMQYENITTETAIAYIEPLVQYNSNKARMIIESTELTVEAGGEGAGMTTVMKIMAWIQENMSKVINIFKNLFKKLYSKYVLFTNNIDKRAKKLSENLSKIQFSNGETFTEEEKSSIASHLAILALYNDKIDKNAISGILNIKDAIIPLENYLTGYGDVINAIAKEMSDKYKNTPDNADANVAMMNKLFIGFYGTMEKSLFNASSNSTKLIIRNSDLFKGEVAKENKYLIYGFSNNTVDCITASFNLETLQKDGQQFMKEAILKRVSFNFDIEKIKPKVVTETLNSNELKELLNALIKYDFKGHIDTVNKAFDTMSTKNKEAIKVMSLSGEYVVGKNELVGLMSQIARLINSQNYNTLNATIFTHINQTARLLSNLLSFAELNMKKFKGGESVVSEAKAYGGPLLLENK